MAKEGIELVDSTIFIKDQLAVQARLQNESRTISELGNTTTV
jgi:hypothetical protein